MKAGVVWINCANLFDAAAPFGGYRESGFGREGGRVGMLDYLAEPAVDAADDPAPAAPVAATTGAGHAADLDRTAKLYIGGAQKRPDGGASYVVPGGLAPLGNRKDIRNAVEAATKAGKWAAMGGHARAAYCRRSKRIFHSRRRTLLAVGIQSCALRATKSGQTFTWCLCVVTSNYQLIYPSIHPSDHPCPTIQNTTSAT